MGCFKEIDLEENFAEFDGSLENLDLQLDILDREVDALDLRCREFEKDVYSMLLPTFEAQYGFARSRFEILDTL